MYAILFHAHQKLDTVARRHLGKILPDNSYFPNIKQILYFEGKNGPDSAKYKKQKKGGEQPWHFINPYDPRDTNLHKEIQYHYDSLVTALKHNDETKASFQAAWLAHAIVDGLTPAHHYPYEEELSRLRGGEGRNTRKGLAGRVIIKGNTMRESALASVKLVGPRGLLTNHMMFEAGAYAIIAPLRLPKAKPTQEELKQAQKFGVVEVFKSVAREIADQGLYHRFLAGGWTLSLNQAVRNQLAPQMAKTITIVWYLAALESGAAKA